MGRLSGDRSGNTLVRHGRSIEIVNSLNLNKGWQSLLDLSNTLKRPLSTMYWWSNTGKIDLCCFDGKLYGRANGDTPTTE